MTGDSVVPPVLLRREARRAAWEAARTAFPPRPVTDDWPATRRNRDAVLDLLAGSPFALPNVGSQRGRLRGVAFAVAWLSDQPGNT